MIRNKTRRNNSTTQDKPCRDAGYCYEDNKDEECTETSPCPFELDLTNVGNDLLPFFLSFLGHPRWDRVRGRGRFAQRRKEYEGPEEPEWREHWKKKDNNKHSSYNCERGCRKNIQNPNLKRYMASVTGSGA